MRGDSFGFDLSETLSRNDATGAMGVVVVVIKDGSDSGCDL